MGGRGRLTGCLVRVGAGRAGVHLVVAGHPLAVHRLLHLLVVLPHPLVLQIRIFCSLPARPSRARPPRFTNMRGLCLTLSQSRNSLETHLEY